MRVEGSGDPFRLVLAHILARHNILVIDTNILETIYQGVSRVVVAHILARHNILVIDTNILETVHHN